MHSRTTTLLLNFAHAIDHMFLLIFATAVSFIARDFGIAHWEDLMPFGVMAFFLFGIGSIPAGRLGDLWGRRAMMIVFFHGMGIAALFAALSQNAWQLAVALAVLGASASIYHPVAIPMLLQQAKRPGWAIGVNGLAGNLGIALAAIVTGYLVKYFDWRMAFAIPGLLSIASGFLFAAVTPREMQAPAKRTQKINSLPTSVLAKVFVVMTLAAVCNGMVFNFTTNANAELLKNGFTGIVEDPALLGTLLAGVYICASLAQLVVGALIDRFPIKRLYLCILLLQPPFFLLAAHMHGWALLALAMLFMAAVFGVVPFTDVVIVRYVDDRVRSRFSGMRLAISAGISSLTVAALGPIVKISGFYTLLTLLAIIACMSFLIVSFLPNEQPATS